MNKQRKVLITITYNEMGIIIDTKAEEVAQPNIAYGCCHPANIAKELAKLPSAQPEIIRCKDCKHYDPNDHCYLQGAEADDFCSYAERREE